MAGDGVDALVLDAADDVATVLRRVEAGERVRVRWADGAVRELIAAEAVALCHKIALHALEAGVLVRKYGEPIGRTLAAVPAGAHVHVHNLASERGRRPAQAGG